MASQVRSALLCPLHPTAQGTNDGLAPNRTWQKPQPLAASSCSLSPSFLLRFILLLPGQLPLLGLFTVSASLCPHVPLSMSIIHLFTQLFAERFLGINMQVVQGSGDLMMCKAKSLPAESWQSSKDRYATSHREAQAGAARIHPDYREGSGKSPKGGSIWPDLWVDFHNSERREIQMQAEN